MRACICVAVYVSWLFPIYIYACIYIRQHARLIPAEPRLNIATLDITFYRRAPRSQRGRERLRETRDTRVLVSPNNI